MCRYFTSFTRLPGLPVKSGRISSRFGETLDPETKETVFHNAIDIAAARGTEVFAVADGAVDSAITKYVRDKGYGNKIVLSHEHALHSVYAHLDKVVVKNGQQVKAGDKIGEVGSTGRSTGPHLHFEILTKNDHQNPEDYFDFSTLDSEPKGGGNSFLMRNPLPQGQVSEEFGYTEDPFTKTRKHHSGIDIKAQKGTVVYASAHGEVVKTNMDDTSGAGYGHEIVIDHGNGLRTRYAHLDTILVKTGQIVQRWRVIGKVGQTGRMTGPVLHYEVHVDGKPVNPRKYAAFLK
ncbi:MAG: M23 family metallopeptidase [bacterium]